MISQVSVLRRVVGDHQIYHNEDGNLQEALR